MSAVEDHLKQSIAQGALAEDLAQFEAARKLDRLGEELQSKGGFFSRPKTLKGVYLWGGVGRGKSMLMDTFYRTVSEPQKQRTHFHDFMLEIHAFIGDWRKMEERDRKRHPAYVRNAGDDPIPPAAKNVANKTRLLCFDEFHVTDIADAMLLGRFYEQLQERDVVMVATSNRHPDDLYKDGINRQLFLPFINQLKASNEVYELRSARDYRLERLEAAPVYYTPLDKTSAEAMDAAFKRLTDGQTSQTSEIEVQGRKLKVREQAGGVARFTFDELCNRPLGAADYLAVARKFHTVLISGVPELGPQNRNEAKRFVTLIDALYEAKSKVIVSAAAEPDTLYTEGDGAFEFERTSSRLFEMRSHDYLAAERVVVEQG